VCALRELGPQARPALPALAAATHDESFGVRAVAVQALASVGGGGTDSVTALTEAMHGSADGDYRWKAARALGQLGPAAVAAAPALVQALSDDNGHVRREAAIALGRIGPAAEAVAAIPLASVLEDPDPTIRVVAARALGRIRAAGAAPALARHLEDDDEAVRQAARASLEAIRDGTR
jgi:HEAT repeat protein